MSARLRHESLAPTLDELPMFATDLQIAEAIVGRDAAEKWMRERMPTLASKPGFPKIDEFHGGRPVKLVAKFYDDYLKTAVRAPSMARGVEDVSAWKPSKHRA